MLSHYSELLSLYRLRILIGSLVSGVLVLCLSLLLLKTSPTYTASVTMNMQPSEEALLFNRQFLGQSQFNPATIITQTHIERLLSRPIAERALDELLADSPEDEPLEPEVTLLGQIKGFLWRTWTRANFGQFKEVSERDQLLNDLRASLNVETVEGSYILQVQASYKFPSTARDIANAVADAYVDIASEEFFEEADRAADGFRVRVQQGDDELRRLIAERDAFLMVNDITDVERQSVLLLTTIQNGLTALAEDQLRLRAKQAELDDLREDIGGSGSASRGPLQTLERELQEIEQLVAFREDLLEEQNIELQTLVVRGSEISGLADEIAVKREDLRALRQQLQSFELGAQSQARQIRLVAPAVTPVYPRSPKVFVNTVAALIVGGLLVFVLAVMQDILGSYIRTRSDLAAVVGNRALPTASPGWLKRASFLRPLLRIRNQARLRRFIEDFGQKMSVDAGWTKPNLFITGYLDQEELIDVRNFIAKIIQQSVARPGKDNNFRVSAVGPIHSVKDWDDLPDGQVIVVTRPDQKSDFDFTGVMQLGSDPARNPLFMLWKK